jgi:hypothetical protein
MLALIFKPVLANENGVGMPAPLTDQSRADFRDERGIKGPTFLREFSGQGLKAAPQGPVRPASSTLLQLMGEGADQQIATEPLRRAGAMQFAPCKPQFLRRALEQFGNLTVDFGDVLTGRRLVRLPPRPGTGDGSPECWRAVASWVRRVMRSPARICGKRDRVPLWLKPA